MLGLRKIFASVRNFFSDPEVKHIETVALNFLARAGLGAFVKQFEQLGIEEFKKLADIHGTEDVKVFVGEAEKNVKALVKAQAKEFHDSWFRMLFAAIVENWQATRNDQSE